jgi:hypothetical protein
MFTLCVDVAGRAVAWRRRPRRSPPWPMRLRPSMCPPLVSGCVEYTFFPPVCTSRLSASSSSSAAAVAACSGDLSFSNRGHVLIPLASTYQSDKVCVYLGSIVLVPIRRRKGTGLKETPHSCRIKPLNTRKHSRKHSLMIRENSHLTPHLAFRCVCLDSKPAPNERSQNGPGLGVEERSSPETVSFFSRMTWSPSDRLVFRGRCCVPGATCPPCICLVCGTRIAE